MTVALDLRINKTVAILAFLALLFSIVYLIFVPHTFAQAASPSAKSAQKLKVCQVHERNIKNRLDSLIRLVTNQETKFGSIAAKVENHYTTKLVPKGEVLPNYNNLVADIGAKKNAVDSDLNAAKTDAAGFSCNVSDPKAQLTTFRKDMQTVKKALKDYRKSIRNLIVAVRTLNPSPSPEGVSK